MTVVGRSNVPESIRSLDTLASPDYVDLFTATTKGANDRSPEEWARAVLEETPTGRSAPALWRRLGLALVWAPVSVLHRRAVPVMLRQALSSHDSRVAAAATGTPLAAATRARVTGD